MRLALLTEKEQRRFQLNGHSSRVLQASIARLMLRKNLSKSAVLP